MLLFRVVFLALKIIYSGHFVPTNFIFQSCLSGTLRKVIFRVSTLGVFMFDNFWSKELIINVSVPANVMFQSCLSGAQRKVIFRVTTLVLRMFQT